MDKEVIRYYPNELIFVIDIESSCGWNRRFPGRELDESSGDIIGIGAAWMFFDYEENKVKCLDTFRGCLYRPQIDPITGKERIIFNTDIKTTEGCDLDRTIFSNGCYTNFWNYDEDAKKALPLLVSDNVDKQTREEAEKEVISNLYTKAEYWKTYAEEHNYKYRLVSDCASFDFGNIDQMIVEHLPGKKGTLHVGGWNGSVRCANTKQETILKLVDPHWQSRRKSKKENSDITVRLQQLYSIPESIYKHNHFPEEDAKNIGWRYLIGCAIENGVYTLNEDLVEQPPEGVIPPYFSRPIKKVKNV